MNLIYKSITKKVALFALLSGIVGCNDAFMDRFPETSITEPQFFKSVKDLEIYTNGMYGYIGASYTENGTDNATHIEDNGIYELLRGELLVNNVGDWSWSSIRNVNFMLARTGNVSGTPEDINHYIGIARMFRAKLYYDMIFSYSDVPWYDKDLQTGDKDLLYKSQDSRAMVMEKVIEDLQFAIENIQDSEDKTRINKNIARTLFASIALTEGTYRKYHPELELSDGDKFLEIARDVAKQVIDSGNYEIVQTSSDPKYGAYQSLFNNLNLLSHKEMIFVADYSQELDRRHNSHAAFDYYNGVSRNFMEDYLYLKDGKAVPFHTITDYDKMQFTEVFTNRDKRMEQTIMPPGFQGPAETKPHVPKIASSCGYPQVKFHPTTADQISWGMCYTDLPIYRYAEVLLIYAEAKAELGELTQDDIDLAIAPLRERAGLPTPMLGDWLANIDPVQEARYNNVDGSQKGAVLEIRRERRLELAFEGRRQRDVYRWGRGELFAIPSEGAYFSNLGLHDLTGDGVDDIAIVNTEADWDDIAETLTEEQKVNISAFILEGNTFRLSEGDKGTIILKAQEGNMTFVAPKYYYTPISRNDIQLNPNLIQNKYWQE